MAILQGRSSLSSCSKTAGLVFVISNCRIVRAHGLKLGDGFGQGFVAGSEGLVDLGGFASADQNQAGIGTTQRPGERKARLW